MVRAIGLVLLCAPLEAVAGWYIEAGASVHGIATDAPEISPTLLNPLGMVEIGRSAGAVSVYVRHTSSIPAVEEGIGLNEAGIKIRYEWR